MHAQIVQFKLKQGASRKDFLALTAQMVALLKEMEGFVAYELYEGSDNWSDRIAWKDASCAQKGRDAFLITDVAKNLIPLVESDYSSFFGEAVIFA